MRTYVRTLSYDEEFSHHVLTGEVFSIGSLRLQKLNNGDFADRDSGNIYSHTLVNEWARKRKIYVFSEFY